jgi:glucose/arabinose dehydrogenase
VLAAETSAPPQPGQTGVMAWVMKLVMKWVGADVPTANRITLLRDGDGGGVAETRSAFLTGLNSPFGMALIGGDFYVANTDAVLRFPYQEGATEITAQGVKVADLPAGPVNYHWTKNIIANRDGSHLFAAIGSNSNAGESGMAAEEGRAAIVEIDAKTGASRPIRHRLA